MRRPYRSLFLSLLFVQIVGFSAAAAEDRGLVLVYEGFLGGLQSSAIKVVAEVRGDSYRLVSDSKSAGVIDTFVGFFSHAVSDGAVKDGEVVPKTHRADNRWFGEDRKVFIDYGSGSGITASVEPPWHDDDRDPVPDHLLPATLDPLSAALRIIRAAGRDGGLPLTVPVFDGRRRYDLHIGPVTADDADGPAYAGPALRAEIVLERIVGFSRRPWLPRSDDPEVATVWLADLVDGLPPIPVRLEAEAVIAPVRVHLVELSVDGTMLFGAAAPSRTDSPAESAESP